MSTIAKRTASLGRYLARRYPHAFRHDIWNIGIVHAPISLFLEANAKPEIKWLPPPSRGKFLADPFAVIDNETVHIFCEEFDYRADKGRIVTMEFNSREYLSRPKVAIELPIHIAYPYLIKHRSEIYCIPETHQVQEVSIYKAEKFPTGWTKAATLIENFAGLDATVFQYEDRWWLTCAQKDGNPTDKLFVWFASDLLGPWSPHRTNPVKRDIRSSRPAGTPFIHDGYLYRPAQDNSTTYGGRILLNRVLKLTPVEFEEEQVAVVEPDKNGPYPDGIHTISALGNITLVDGKRFKKPFQRS